MRSPLGNSRWLGLGLIAALFLSACGSSENGRRPQPRHDAGADAAPSPTSSSTPDSGKDSGPTPPRGPTGYAGSTRQAGGVVMKGGKYVLFSVTGEVPGTSGLRTNSEHRLVGGVVGHASY